MYDPNLGRFLQTDPLGYSQGMNLYAYVMNDPANVTDPSGKACDPAPDLPHTFKYDANGNVISETVSSNAYSCRGGNFDLVAISTLVKFSLLATAKAVEELSRRTPIPNPRPPKSKPYVCSKLEGVGYNVGRAWAAANADRKSVANGRKKWGSDPISREGENWLTSAAGYLPLGVGYGVGTAQIVGWSAIKLPPFRWFHPTTPFSLDALDAGLSGLDHYGDTSAQLESWCNEEG